MPKTITTRLPDEYVKALTTIEKFEQLDTSTVVRRLLASAIAEWKKEHAVEQYRKGKFSFGQVARFAEISVWDVPLLLKEKNVPLNLSVEDWKAELATIRKWEKK